MTNRYSKLDQKWRIQRILFSIKYSNLVKNLMAFTTTKQTLLERNPTFTGNSPKNFKGNRKQLSNRLNTKTCQLIFPRQTHTNCVAEILNIPETEIKDTDALVTNQQGICLYVQTADCVPILLFDPMGKVIGAVHAGWQ